MPPLAPNIGEMLSEPVKLRLRSIRDVLSCLDQAKKAQDSTPKNPSAGKGVWISFPLWRAIVRQLNSQIAEIHEWEKLLLSTQQEAGSTRQQLLSFEQTMLANQRANEKQCAGLEDLLAQQQASMFEQQRSWSKQRDDLSQQTDRALQMLKDREQVAVENEHLVNALREAQVAAAQADVRAQEAEMRAAAMQQQSNYFVDKTSDGQADRTALAHQVRDLGLALSQARAQVEQYRQQQLAKQRPAQELLEDLQRLRVDNQRLVGLLSGTKAWKRIAKDLSVEGGSHYIPVEEALVHKGNISSTYTPLKDRPVELAALGSDPEEWHWVPQQAVSVALEAVANLLPTTPLKPLFHVLLSFNKVWRQREEKKVAAMKQQHASELRELHRLYRQRAPYEAVVGNTRLSDLKKQLRLQAAHARQLAAEGEGRVHEARDDGQMFLALGLDSVNALNQQVITRLQGNNTRLCRKLAAARKQPLLCPACTSLSVPKMPPLAHEEQERPSLSQSPRTQDPSAATQGASLMRDAFAAAPQSIPSYPHPPPQGQSRPHTSADPSQPPPRTAAAPLQSSAHAHTPAHACSHPPAHSVGLSQQPAATAAAAARAAKPGPSGTLSRSAADAPALRVRDWDSYLPARYFPSTSSTNIPPAELAAAPARLEQVASAAPLARLELAAPQVPAPARSPAPASFPYAPPPSQAMHVARTDSGQGRTDHSEPENTAAGRGAHSSMSMAGQLGGHLEGFGSAFYPADKWSAEPGVRSPEGGQAESTQPQDHGSQHHPHTPSNLACLSGQHHGPHAAAPAATRMTRAPAVVPGGGTLGVAEVHGSHSGGGSGCDASPACGVEKQGLTGSQSGDGGGVRNEPHPFDGAGRKAAHLARLIHKYEQPVLRFSLWDREGRLQPS